jgi:hypothetical protein
MPSEIQLREKYLSMIKNVIKFYDNTSPEYLDHISKIEEQKEQDKKCHKKKQLKKCSKESRKRRHSQ